MIHDEFVVAKADTRRRVIVDRLSELDWLVEVVNKAIKADQDANKS